MTRAYDHAIFPQTISISGNNVGIRQKLPSYPLHVDGSGYFASGLSVSGSLILNGTGLVSSQLGINNPAPSSVLDVIGESRMQGILYFNQNSTDAGDGSRNNCKIERIAGQNLVLTGASNTIQLAGDAGKLILRASSVGVEIGSQYSNTYVMFNPGNSEKARITTSGLLGIGTSSPTHQLHVVGSGFIASGLAVSGLLSVNGTGISVSGHTHTSSNITDFNSTVSGLLPVKDIVAGTNVTVSSSSGIYTINSTAGGGGGGGGVVINNSGDNRILTSTGSTSGINAESNLTFDGSLLTVNGSGLIGSIVTSGNTIRANNTNSSLVLSPNGSGSLQTSSGGDTRGAYSIDLQINRSSGTMVAGAEYSVIGGGVNNRIGTVQVNSVICGGSGNTITGGNLHSTIGGGKNNTIAGNYGESNVIAGGTNNTLSTYSYYNTIGGGDSNSIINGSTNTICGGYDNSITDSNCVIGGGSSNTCSSWKGIILGGTYNQVNNISAIILGGSFNHASGIASSIIGGNYSKTSHYGEIAHSNERFVNVGDAQHSILMATRQTSDGTANQVLFLDGSSLRLTIPAKTAWTFEVKLSAYNDTDSAAAGWIFRGVIRRNGANGTAIVGSIIEENWKDSAMNSTSASVVADDTNEALEIRVTGLAAKEIRWVAVVDISQVSYGTP